jgi:AraC-like DNA-binding protein
MTSAAEFAPIRFSTDDFPTRDRVAVLCDVFGRQLLRLDAEPVPDTPFFTHIKMRALPGLRMFSGTASGTRFRRTRELMADGNDEIGLVVKMRGASVISQRSHESLLDDGDACLFSSGETSLFSNPSRVQSVGFGIPYAALAPLVTNVEDAFGRAISRNTEALRLLIGYIGTLEDDDALQSSEVRHAVVAHIHDLIALTIGATRDAAAVAQGRGVRAARLRAIKTDIRKNLANPALSIGAIARRHQVTARYIQVLFSAEGTTYSDFVLGQRLTSIRRALTAPQSADRNISAIVFAGGFSDLSYFNKSFRKLYRQTPSDVRTTASDGDKRR